MSLIYTAKDVAMWMFDEIRVHFSLTYKFIL